MGLKQDREELLRHWEDALKSAVIFGPNSDAERSSPLYEIACGLRQKEIDRLEIQLEVLKALPGVEV